MQLISTIKEMQAISNQYRKQGKTIGFVPTMGYLHEGHLSLIRIAKANADIVVLSIYVNPTQFAPNEDLSQYPRDFDRDEQLAKQEGVEIIFYPDDKEMYPAGYKTFVEVEDLTQNLCGASRPTHFRGVTTICTKLFNSVKPHCAVFGQKDYQQALIIQRMVKDLNLDLQMIVAPIVREEDGLAMSSRNKYLSGIQRKQALSLNQSLQLAHELFQKGERNTVTLKNTIRNHISRQSEAHIDYIEIVDAETLSEISEIKNTCVIALAVFFEKTRLIDNIILKS